jgi:probable HAF family extracellular repeat protein
MSHNKTASLYYVVQSLGSLGGRNCCLVVEPNDLGWVDGTSNLKGNKSFHPFLWRNGKMEDLGTLGGPNSSVGGMNDHGIVTVGGSDTGKRDPLGEDFCGDGTHQTCLSFIWQRGKRTLLPTLGGNNNDVATVNNHDLVVAFAETKVKDSSCVKPQVLRYEAFTWQPQTGKIRRLPPLPGDSVSEASGIDEHGDAAGYSGTCGPILSIGSENHAALWRNGKPTDLGNLGGGNVANSASGINNHGQVVGVSALPGDKTAHAFLWENGRMSDLGTLPGDHLSSAAGINDSGQVVGESCKSVAHYPHNCRIFIWQNGAMADLNTLVRPASSLHLIHWGDINEHGDVVGQAYDHTTGAFVPFLAVRCDPKRTIPKACMGAK